MLAPGENGETGKFLWSSSLFIRPQWYPDSYINTCFSDLKRFGIMKKFLWTTDVDNFFTRTQSFAQHFCPVTPCILSLIGFPCNRIRVRVI